MQQTMPMVMAKFGMMIFAFMYFAVVIAVAVTLLICIWRAMKAHESIAQSLKAIAFERSGPRDV